LKKIRRRLEEDGSSWLRNSRLPTLHPQLEKKRRTQEQGTSHNYITQTTTFLPTGISALACTGPASDASRFQRQGLLFARCFSEMVTTYSEGRDE